MTSVSNLRADDNGVSEDETVKKPEEMFTSSTRNGIVVVVVGGTEFRLSRPAVLAARHFDTTLTRAVLNKTNLSANKERYCFDRNAQVFTCVVDYYRTGEMHIPHGVCGEFVRKELIFWGIPKKDVSPCCLHKLGRYQRKLQERRKIEKEFSRRCVEDVWPIEEEEEKRGCCLTSGRKRKLWRFLNEPRSSKASMIFSAVCFFFIITSIAVMMVNTLHSTRGPFSNKEEVMAKLRNAVISMNITNEKISMRLTTTVGSLFFTLDYICLAFFTVEFILRLTAERNRCAFLRSTYAILDLLAILPPHIDIWIKGAIFSTASFEDYSLLTLLWVSELFFVFKILRLFRLTAYYDGLRVLLLSLKASWKELVLLEVFLMIGMSVFGTLVYYAEILDKDSFFSDILVGCWWAVITMTTVGYGDTYPKSTIGFAVGVITATFGILLMGLPIAIISNNFSKYYNYVAENREIELEGKGDGNQSKTTVIRVEEFQPSWSNTLGASFPNSAVAPEIFDRDIPPV